VPVASGNGKLLTKKHRNTGRVSG